VMHILRGAMRAVLPALCIWLILALAFHAVRGAGYRAGYSACKAEMQDRAQLAYRQGREAGAEEVATGAYEAGRCQGWLDALAVWEQGGSEAMKVQLAVVKGER